VVQRKPKPSKKTIVVVKKIVKKQPRKVVAKKPRKLTAEQLDKQLDNYFVKNGDTSKVKNSLDMELDQYMKKAKKQK